MQKTILVTGGLGYIGSHTITVLLEAGYRCIVVDNLSNSTLEIKDRLLEICPQGKLEVHVADILDQAFLEQLFAQESIDAVFHFAALKAVGESCQQPLRYYRENMTALLNLLEVMDKHGVEIFIQSSSATVYSDGDLPYKESNKNIGRAASPYGQTKVNNEFIIQDVAQATSIRAAILRYFNPVGSHPSGKIGEFLSSLNNLFPFIGACYLGQKEELVIFGNDYDTRDGTNERDYIHVMDLAEGHLKALQYLESHPAVKVETFNLGNGKPISNTEIITAFNNYSDRQVKFSYGARRPGDLPVSYADPSKARELLGFECQRSFEEMVRSTLNFLKLNYK